MTKTEALYAARRIIVDIDYYNESGDPSFLANIRDNAKKVQGFIYKV